MEIKLTHGSLFSGIGGGDIGFDLAGFDNRFQVENDPFCREVLEIRKSRWPNVQLFSDVRDVGKHNLPFVDVISGGFPCHDISTAGKKLGIGTYDNPTKRSGLWFEFARIIGECRPPWVLIENVPGLKIRGGDQVFSDLEAANYAFWPTVVGAEIFGAPHQRNRVWVLCHDNALGHRDFGERMGAEWEVPPDFQRALEEKSEEWGHWKHVVGPGNCGPRADAYPGIVRDVHGIPDWVDRLKSCGNAMVPLIPAFFAAFISEYERLARNNEIMTSCESNITTPTANS
jgi:DNA (cytosine-5)-methyltransferase 1